MKNKIFYCDTNYRGALVSALLDLKMLNKNTISLKKLLELTWWKRIEILIPGQLLEIGMDSYGSRVFILSVPMGKELVAKIASKLTKEMSLEGELLLIDVLKVKNRLIKMGRLLNLINRKNPLSHYLFIMGILKLINSNLIKESSSISVFD